MNAPHVPGWDAQLDLDFARRGDRSLLTRARHTGPLVVQKPLYPEGEALCQVIVVHPPGGIAGGDRLALTVDVDTAAHAQLTTPGATKWYRSAARPARQTIALTLGKDAICEWLPQETIVFNGAHAQTTTRVVLGDGATFLGWDIVCLGRIASGERFESGGYRQCVELVRGDALIWTERTIVDPASAFARSAVGLADCPIFATFVAAAPLIEDNAFADCRRAAARAAAGACAVTRLPGVLIARYRGDSTEDARRCFVDVWSQLRPALCKRDAVTPRIWNT